MNKKINILRKAIKKNYKLFLILFFLIIFWFLIYPVKTNLLWDEAAYLSNARSHITVSNYVEDFRFPLLEYLIAIIWYFTGESILVARMLIMSFAIGTVLIFYLISKKILNANHNFATFSFTLSILFLEWSFRVYTDIPSIFFVLTSFYFFLKNSKLSYFISGIFSGLAFLMRFTTSLFPILFALILIIKKENKNLLFYTLGIILSLTPWLVFNLVKYKNPIWDLLEQYKVVNEWTSWESLGIYLKNLLINFHFFLLFLIFGLFLFFKFKDSRKRLVYPILFFTTYLMYTGFFVNIKLSRYLLVFSPFLFLVSFEAINFLSSKKVLRILIFIIIITSAFFQYLSVVVLENHRNFCENEGSTTKTINFLDKNILDQNDHILSNNWVYYGYFNNVMVNSFYSDDLISLASAHKTKFIIYNLVSGLTFNKSYLDQNFKLLQKFEGACSDTTYIYSGIKINDENL